MVGDPDSSLSPAAPRPPARGSGIRVQNVTKVYPNGVKAVDDVTLEIADGEFLVLVGPSGCGKSTLLRMIAGLEDSHRRAHARSATADVTDVLAAATATSRWSSRTTRSTRT